MEEKNLSSTISRLLPIFLLVTLVSLAGGQPKAVMAQALCLSQFALANEACSFVNPHSINLQSNNNHHHHHHHHHHQQHGDTKDSACCRRLEGIDDACVCQLMTRLPSFVTKPKHKITIVPNDGCEVSYECGAYE
ncbi:hypothetical protein HPP92_007867 [Vanilla planifolia]|uniref:Bifunctional inhibitor/plant lipid transfer protein/seed storage helical domain-containing protein n=1 Tax=Vanilla planifolia TaxID=51239 RepID=A0A835V840_VANPL|nr:hypothetical protein HPP92_008197 [Vanilla planifolia]KAG0491004.1 hypothetical protein HPP92_007867 [Vanilla planifolia]